MSNRTRQQEACRADGSRTRGLLIAITVLILLCSAAVAAAQLEQAETPALPDTEVTPDAKDATGLWQRVAGADFGAQAVDASSPT